MMQYTQTMSGSIGGWQSDTDETSASESVYEDAIDGMEDSSDEELDTSSNTLNGELSFSTSQYSMANNLS